MIKTLAIKELRESAAIVAIALLVLLHILAMEMQWQMLPWISVGYGDFSVPFLGFSDTLLFFGGALAIGLGLKQSAWENAGNQYYFLLHRPIARPAVFLLKLLVGLAILETLLAGSILLYANWAATAGSKPAPFDWGMTTKSWCVCLITPSVYLGAFLSGLRPGRWLGTRLLPLVATGFIVAAAVAAGEGFGAWFGLVLLVVLDLILLRLILAIAATRDY